MATRDRGVYGDLLNRRFQRSDAGFSRNLCKKTEMRPHEEMARVKRREENKARLQELNGLASVQANRPLKPPGR